MLWIIVAVLIIGAIAFYLKKVACDKSKTQGDSNMAYGLQVFDENSRVIFDLSHSTSRFIGSDQLTASYPNAVSKTLSVSKNSSSEKIFYYLQLVSADLNFNQGFNGGNAWAVVDDTNNTITFTVYWGTYKIYYGVYVP